MEVLNPEIRIYPEVSHPWTHKHNQTQNFNEIIIKFPSFDLGFCLWGQQYNANWSVSIQ